MIPNCYRCEKTASGWMAIDYQNRRVWLWDISLSGPQEVLSPICREHADRLSPPLKWTLFDRRNVTDMFQASKESGAA